MKPLQPNEYTRRLEHLLEVCKDLTANLELEPLLSAIIEAASELTQSEWSQILIFDTDKKYLSVVSAPFFMLDSLKTIGIPLDQSMAGKVLETQQVIVYHKDQTDATGLANLTWEREQKTTSVLAVPLVYHGESVGVIEAFNKEGNNAYDHEDVFFLEVLASQAATAIQNHQLILKNEAAIHKAMELDRMKSDFISIASHELRTPLGLIMGHASFLSDTATDEQKEDLAVITRSTGRLRDLIDEFAEIDTLTGGMTRLKRNIVSLNQVVEEVITDHQRLADEGKVKLLADVRKPNLTVEGDKDKISIALRHLVKNALNFTNPGGTVKVGADALPGYVKLTVVDNGIGIPQTELQNIFKRFYQVEKHLTRRHSGMGLGLAVTKEMVEMHGGKVLVESVEGKGSRFTILIPLNLAQATAAERVFLS
jgi:signal transduction histidine kinase